MVNVWCCVMVCGECVVLCDGCGECVVLCDGCGECVVLCDGCGLCLVVLALCCGLEVLCSSIFIRFASALRRLSSFVVYCVVCAFYSCWSGRASDIFIFVLFAMCVIKHLFHLMH